MQIFRFGARRISRQSLREKKRRKELEKHLLSLWEEGVIAENPTDQKRTPEVSHAKAFSERKILISSLRKPRIFIEAHTETTTLKGNEKQMKKKQLRTEAKQDSWRDALAKSDWEEFGNFVKRRVSNTIPANITGAAVVPYLDANPKATELGKVGPTGGGGMSRSNLVNFFKSARDLRNRLGSTDLEEPMVATTPAGGDEEDKALRARARELAQQAIGQEEPAGYNTGDEVFRNIGDLLGVTTAGAKKISDRAEGLVQRLFSTPGIHSLNNATEEQEDAIFGRTGVINRVVSVAATDYANAVIESIDDDETWEDGVSMEAISAAFKQLERDLNVVPSGDRSAEGYDRETEKMAVLIALGMEGDIDDVADEVIRDWESDSNALSSFQDLVAARFKQMYDKEDIAAGVKGKRGRPSKAQQAAEQEKPAEVVQKLASIGNTAATLEPVKRGRGRPRKEEQSPAPPEPVKRGRGRPPKAR